LANPELKPKPIRVLIVAPSMNKIGGQSVQAARLVEKFVDEPEVEVDFLPVDPKLSGPLHLLQKIKFVRTILTSLAYWLLLFREVNRHDVIHIFSASYSSFLIAPTPALMIAKLFGKKVILNYHSGQLRDHLTKWPGAIKTMKRFDRIVVPSEYLMDVFAEFGLRARAVYNFVETDKYNFRNRVPLKPVFLSNRTFESHYNVSCVLRAFAEIQKNYPESSLAVAGDGPQREKLKALAEKLNLRNVEFAGFVPQDKMPALCDASEILLNSPNIDNMPLSLIEAYAAGLPIISTNAGGIPYLVHHEETGLLVDINDHLLMARAATRLLEDPILAEKLIRNGKRECEKYGWEPVRENWLNLYRDLAKES
jgi:glycosyltransferase involved in cell wall biosynthesis